MRKTWWKRLDFFFPFFFYYFSLRNGLTAPGWSMCLSQLLCHPGNHGDHDDRLDAIWSQPHKKKPTCTRARTYAHALTKTKQKKKAADGNQATRPVSRESEPGRGTERCRQREIMREREKKRQRKKRWGWGRQRSKEIRGDKGKRETWEWVLGWCDFWGTCLGGAEIIYTACKSVLLWGWRARLREIKEEEKSIKIPSQIQGEAHGSAVNTPLHTSAPASANPLCKWSGQTRSLSKDVRRGPNRDQSSPPH